MRKPIAISGFTLVFVLGFSLLVGLRAQAHADEPTDPADAEAIAAIKELGGTVRRIAANTEDRQVEFHLTGKELTDEGLAHVSRLKDVAWLNLRGTQITSQGLVHLKGLTTLRHLHLENTEVDDEGIVHLKGLPNLEYLNLYATNVTDKSLNELKELKKLRWLFLWQTDVTDEAVARLEEALPQLTIQRGAGLDPGSSVRKRVIVDDPVLPIAGRPWKVAGVRYEDENPGPKADGNIYFRQLGTTEYSSADLARTEDGHFEGTVPAEITGKPFQYYIRIREPKRPPSTFPAAGAKEPAEVTPDAAPPNLAEAPQAGDVKSYRVALTWKAATDDLGIAAYAIYRGKEQGSAVEADNLLAKVEPDTLQFNDDKPPAGQTVFYAIEPIDVAGRTGEARTVQVDVPENTPPDNELKLTAAAGSKSVVLDWTGAIEADVQQILVFRAASADDEAKQVAAVDLADAKRWIDKEVEDDVKYRYFVKLRDAGGLVSKPSGIVTAESGGFLRRINCGGPKVASPDGAPWEADAGSAAGTGVFTNKSKIAGASDALQAVYQSERWSYRGVRYRFDAEPGHYRATLHFAETNNTFSAVGKRTFDVFINGEKRHAGVDVFAKAGKETAWQLDTEFELKDNEIVIELRKVAAGPAIKGIEVREISKAHE